MFYLMEAVEGTIHWDAALPNLTSDTRRKIYEAMISTLANLHLIDYAAMGLGDYGVRKLFCPANRALDETISRIRESTNR